MGATLIRLKDVIKKTGLGRSGIYLLVSRGDFPKQIRLGSTASVAWSFQEVEDWCNQQIVNRDKVA